MLVKPLVICAALLLSLWASAPVSAATRACGTERALSHGAVFKVTATGTTCKTAKQVAGGWYNVQSEGGSARYVFDERERRWRCRITERATGTDPGYNPYTSVRCVRGPAAVRFKLRS
jgi:hypothetical protein